MTHSSDVSIIGNTITPTKAVHTYEVVARDESETRPAVYASGDLYTFYTTTRESNGAFNFFDFFLPVNGGPPPHYHPYEHEIWHITDGEIRFNLGNLGEKSLVLPRGTTIFGPINRTHGYRNDDSAIFFSDIQTPGARTLSMTTPGALDLFFDAAAKRVVDRDDPPPIFTGPTPDDFLNLAKFYARTDAGIVLVALDPDYVPPADSLPYVLILGDDASPEVVDAAKELMSDPSFKVWTTGSQAGIPQRPTFIGDFGITYTSLVNFQETGDKFEYNQFSLGPNSNNLGTVSSGEDNIVFYVEGDNNPNTNKQLTISISHNHGPAETKVITAEEDTYIYIAPGNSYSISNPSGESVEALSITIPQNPEAAPQPSIFTSPLLPESTIEPTKNIQLGAGDDVFSQSGAAPNTYRSFFDVAPGYSDYFLQPIVINGVQYQGTFESAAINPSTGKLVVDTGAFKFVNGSFEELLSRNFTGSINLEILRDDYRQLAGELGQSERVGVIAQLFFASNQATTTIPSVIATLPADIEAGVSELSKSNPLPPNGFTPLPFEDPNRYSNPYDFLVIPAFEFAFDVFRDKPKADGGLPIPIVGKDLGVDSDSFGWIFEAFESRRLIKAGAGNDTVYLTKDDTAYGEDGNDTLDSSQGKGRNKLYGGLGNDNIWVNYDDRAFGQDGDDVLDASKGIGLDGLSDKGRNLLDGGHGSDILIAGSNGELYGGEGNDQLFIRSGGNNLLYGGAGQDKFWIVNGVLPETTQITYSDFAKSLLPPFLSFPELRDTKNTIKDFQLGVDKIYIKTYIETNGINLLADSFDDLQLLPTFGDLYSTSIIAKVSENDVIKEISLANVEGIIFNELTANDFVFVLPGDLVVGSPQDDTLIAKVDFVGLNDRIFTGAGNDEVEVAIGGEKVGDNRINTGSGKDTIYVANGDRAFGSAGDDLLDATDSTGARLSGGAGNDDFYLGVNGRALGGEGDDKFWVQEGGGNLLTGGAGADQFWITTGDLPTTPNTIVDFQSGIDVIGVAGQGAGFDFTDLTRTGNDILIGSDKIATLVGIQTNTLTAANFVFV